MTLVVLLLMTGCQAMTGQTMGETIDDSYITGAVKTQLASDKLVSLTRVEIETNNGVVYLTGEVESAAGEVARRNSGAAAKGRQKGRQ